MILKQAYILFTKNVKRLELDLFLYKREVKHDAYFCENIIDVQVFEHVLNKESLGDIQRGLHGLIKKEIDNFLTYTAYFSNLSNEHSILTRFRILNEDTFNKFYIIKAKWVQYLIEKRNQGMSL